MGVDWNSRLQQSVQTQEERSCVCPSRHQSCRLKNGEPSYPLAVIPSYSDYLSPRWLVFTWAFGNTQNSTRTASCKQVRSHSPSDLSTMTLVKRGSSVESNREHELWSRDLSLSFSTWVKTLQATCIWLKYFSAPEGFPTTKSSLGVSPESWGVQKCKWINLTREQATDTYNNDHRNFMHQNAEAIQTSADIEWPNTWFPSNGTSALKGNKILIHTTT